MRMDPLRIIRKFYDPDSLCYSILIRHSAAVYKKANELASCLDFSETDCNFIHEAVMLHDIGIFYTSAPTIGCNGDLPYICHGFKGHELLLAEGLPKHALVCERHTGAGITLDEIEQLGDLLPHRPFIPVSNAEMLISYCDKFFSKEPGCLEMEKTIETILQELSRHGQKKAEIFLEWHQRFSR